MEVTRRQFLQAGAAAGAFAAGTPALNGSSGFELRRRPTFRWAAQSTDIDAPPIEVHLLNRCTFGARPGDLDHVQSLGLDDWIEEQLNPEGIDDSAVEEALLSLPTLTMHGTRLWTDYQMEQYRVQTELVAATLFRAVMSKRQLFEVMVEFWTDHFTIYHNTGLTAWLKTVDDREVIRRHALGTFRELVHASAKSPAMLVYLDNYVNRRGVPNENYARELMELHTMGVDGGYTEADVLAVARVFTGWTIDVWRGRGRNPGDYVFNSDMHDAGLKTVLGEVITNSGEREGEFVIDMLVDHPATRLFIARKLVRRLVSDNPPDSLVQRVAAAFGRDGDIKAMLGEILRSREFAQSFGQRIRRPFDYWAGAMRVLGAAIQPQTITGRPRAAVADPMVLVQEPQQQTPPRYSPVLLLRMMDHVPFNWLTPDGYPDYGEAWTASSVMLARWNYGLALTENRLNGIQVNLMGTMNGSPEPHTTAGEIVDFWTNYVLHRQVMASDRALLVDFVANGGGDSYVPSGPELTTRVPMLVALLLDGPYFMWR
jgi:uncharacterized protein (DUF1800 family)